MRTQSSFVGWDFNNVWTFQSGVNNGFPVLQGGGGGSTTPTDIVLTVDYMAETISIKDDEGNTPNLALYSYVVEIGGKLSRVEQLYSDTLNISAIIPQKSGRDVKVVIIKADAVPDVSKKDLSRFSNADRVSNMVTLAVRSAKIAKNELTIDNINERITGSGSYDFRTSIGTWQTIILSPASSISISNFQMGGIIEIRKSGTATSAAGVIMRLKIRNRPNAPKADKISVNNGIFKGVSDKMEYSTDGITWTAASKNLSSTGFATGTIHFRMKATEKAMKSFPASYSHTSN